MVINIMPFLCRDYGINKRNSKIKEMLEYGNLFTTNIYYSNKFEDEHDFNYKKTNQNNYEIKKRVNKK